MKNVIKTSSFLLIATIMSLILLTGCEKWTEKTDSTTYFKGQQINGLIIEGPANVVVNKATDQFIAIEINDNLKKDLKVTRDINGIVKIEIDNLIVPNGKNLIFNVTASIGSLVKLDVEDGCNVTFNNEFDGASCELSADHASVIKNLKLNLTNNFIADISMSSQVWVTVSCNNMNLEVDDASQLNIEINQCMNATVEVDNSSKIDASANNTMTFSGNNLTLNGSSNSIVRFDAIGFSNIIAKVQNGSTGYIWAINSLSATALNGSALYYKGNPNINFTDIDNTSELSQIK